MQSILKPIVVLIFVTVAGAGLRLVILIVLKIIVLTIDYTVVLMVWLVNLFRSRVFRQRKKSDDHYDCILKF